MTPIRIACVRYLNTAPLIEGLEKLAGCELIPTAPARIAGMVEAGEADIGLASVIDAAAGTLALLPVGMIGCDGPTMTVRVFSSVPMERVRELHADAESHTSVVLCQIVLKRLYGVRARVVEWDAGESGQWNAADGKLPETVLLIGDKVVTDAPPAERYPYQLDLGEAWRELTGLPFVYAMWMCRADRAGDETILQGAALLDRQRRHNRTRLDWIVSDTAPDHGWPVELASRYLGSLLTYEVGEGERKAVERFLELAVEDDLIASASPRWASLDPVGAA